MVNVLYILRQVSSLYNILVEAVHEGETGVDEAKSSLRNDLYAGNYPSMIVISATSFYGRPKPKEPNSLAPFSWA